MKKLKTLKKLLHILFLATLLTSLVGLGYLFFQNNLLRQQLENKSNAVEQKEEELKTREEEINLCIEDRAKIIETCKAPYSFQEFGIYSPLFEGKEVEKTTFRYKRNTITRESVILDEEIEGHSGGISVWELSSSTSSLPILEDYTGFYQQKDFPIFDGYENYGLSPVWISTRMSDWKNPENLYVNKNDINMHWVYQYAPKTIGSVHLEFYNPNSPRGHQIFVSLWASVKNYPLVKDKTESSVIKAKEALKKIADTIDLRPRHE